ncbi:hypothetical protein GQ44DRAFT_607729, partial [Phaeosphaeriaceae sp. PMI808]
SPNMPILFEFRLPQDVRWQGTQRRHHKFFLSKNILLFLFTILIIVEYALFKSFWENEKNYLQKAWKWAPYNFWLRIGIAYIPDVLLTIVTLVLIFNPLHHSTYSFHPVFALSSSLVMVCLYVALSFMDPLYALSNEVPFSNSEVWEYVVFVETGVQCAIGILWILMVVYSSIAVHKWRMAKKSAGVEVKMGSVEGARSEEGRV